MNASSTSAKAAGSKSISAMVLATSSRVIRNHSFRVAAVIFASNLWREGQEDYDNATPPDYKAQLKGCWARRVDLFLKVARDLYPQECCGITVSDIEREVQAA